MKRSPPPWHGHPIAVSPPSSRRRPLYARPAEELCLIDYVDFRRRSGVWERWSTFRRVWFLAAEGTP